MDLVNYINELVSEINKKTRFEKFEQFAQIFLNEYELVLDNHPWYIKEIEVYINAPKHPDPFTHEHNDYETGQFRIHNSGIDIAIRNGDTYGGILLRGIENPGVQKIQGPVNVCDSIIKYMGTINKASISLKKRESQARDDVYCAPRVGLKPKRTIEDTEKQFAYLIKNYRFFTDININEEKYLIYLSLQNNFKEAPKLELDQSTMKTYKEAFDKGKAIGKDQLLSLLDNFNLTNKAILYGYYTKTLDS